jgi:hypothetical protein
MATYPNSIFFWQPRIDQQNIVFANDPNTLANEIIAVEQVVGVNPQTEKHPPIGTGYTYRTLDSRVSAAMANLEMPFAEFTANQFFINQGAQMFQTYRPAYDPFGIFDGQCATIPTTGWWQITAGQKWNQQGDNFIGGNAQFLFINGAWVTAEIWEWDNFFGNPAYHFASNITSANGFTRIFWQGVLNKGAKVQMLAVNSTFCPGINVNDIYMTLYCSRVTPPGTIIVGGAASGSASVSSVVGTSQ